MNRIQHFDPNGSGAKKRAGFSAETLDGFGATQRGEVYEEDAGSLSKFPLI